MAPMEYVVVAMMQATEREEKEWHCFQRSILYVLLAGYLPFQDKNLMDMYKKIYKAELKWPSWFSSDARRLLRRILDPNPGTRISFSEILENSWFRTGLDSGLIGYNTPTEGIVAVDMDPTCDPFSSCTTETIQEATELTNLNAFDIISLSSGFDLSGLFEDKSNKESKFTSTNTAATIITKLEDIAKRLRLRLMKKDGGLLKMESLQTGRKGVMSIDTEIFQIAPNYHLVEIKKTNGDTLEYQKVKHDMRPALKDIVWAWQGEQP